MNDIEKVYLKRKNDNPNSIYIVLRELKNNNLVILKEIDTINDDEDIKLEVINDFKKDYYPITSLLAKENYIGKTGYYKEMCELEQMVYETFIVLYRDKNYELIYDVLGDRNIINNCCYEKETFVETKQKTYAERVRL